MTKNLPLTDDVLYMDNTMLEAYTTCPRLFEYSWLYRRRLAEQRAALNCGSAVHDALDTRHKLLGLPDVDLPDLNKAMLQTISDFFKKSPAPLDDYRNESFVADLMLMYNGYYPDEPYRIMTNATTGDRLSECSFAEPLASFDVSWQDKPVHVVWTGKIDLVTQWPDDSIWIVDAKTSSRLGSGYFNDFLLSQQQTGYVWAAQRKLGVSVRGYMIDAIGTHKLTSKKSADDRFLRQKFDCDTERLEEWYHNTCVNIQDMLDDYGRDFFPMRTEKHCNGKYGKCAMLDVCMLPRVSRGVMLASGMYEDNTWSPLKQEEENGNKTV